MPSKSVTGSRSSLGLRLCLSGSRGGVLRREVLCRRLVKFRGASARGSHAKAVRRLQRADAGDPEKEKAVSAVTGEYSSWLSAVFVLLLGGIPTSVLDSAAHIVCTPCFFLVL